MMLHGNGGARRVKLSHADVRHVPAARAVWHAPDASARTRAEAEPEEESEGEQVVRRELEMGRPKKVSRVNNMAAWGVKVRASGSEEGGERNLSNNTKVDPGRRQEEEQEGEGGRGAEKTQIVLKQGRGRPKKVKTEEEEEGGAVKRGLSSRDAGGASEEEEEDRNKDRDTEEEGGRKRM
eukprot:986116-Rhodomonas_salina.1